MSKNLEVMKAINSLEIDQKKLTKELLILIYKISAGFKDEARESIKMIADTSELCGGETEDYSDDPKTYYANISLLINGLIDNLNDSLGNFSKIVLSYIHDFLPDEEIVSEQSKENEQIWQIFNELTKYAKNDEEELEEDDYDEDDNEEIVSLEELAEQIKQKLIVFEENVIILIKLYNQYCDKLKVTVPQTFFSSEEELMQNEVVLMLMKRGVEIK